MAPETVIRMTHLKLLVKFVNKQESTNSASKCDFEDAVSLLEVVDSYQHVRSKVLNEPATAEFVERLDAGNNVLEECLSEVERPKRRAGILTFHLALTAASDAPNRQRVEALLLGFPVQ
jgi:hypothetical protein